MADLSRFKVARQRLICSGVAVALLPAGVALADDGPEGAPRSQMAEVVVTGQSLSTQSSIEAKKTSDLVIDVISADNLGKIPDATVADSLSHIPGVSTIVNQDTGEGQFVTIRGLAGTYNYTTINGVRVAQTDSTSRDVSLNLLPPNGLASITVSKTLTPDQDGDAIGGMIDFRTPTAFDFKKDQVVRAWASGGFNDRARSSHEASGLSQGQIDFGKRLGDDRFGVFVSANYGISHGNGQEVENEGEWEPYQWRKDDKVPISQSNMHLPGIDNDYRRIRQKRYGGNFSLDYHGDDATLYLRGQYARLDLTGTNDTLYYNDRRTPRLSQVNPNDTSLRQPGDMITGVDPVKGKVYGYTPAQIVDADGDGRITDADRNSNQFWSLNGSSGVWNPQAYKFARNIEVIDNRQTLGTLDFGGQNKLDRLTVSYDLSYSTGSQETPDDYSISYACDQCRFPLNTTGIDWVSAEPRFPQPSVPAYAQNVPHDPSLLSFDGASLKRIEQTDTRWAGKLDVRYDLGGVIDHLQAGLKWSRSSRHHDETPVWSGDFSGTPLDGKNLADSGLIDKEVNNILGKRYYYGAIFNRQSVIAAIAAAKAAQPGNAPSADDLLSNDNRSSEKIIAGYALAKFQFFEQLGVIAGARLEHRSTHTEFWKNDGTGSGFDTTDRSYNVVLPSATATWRPDPQHAYRAAVWTGYSAPEYGNLTSGATVTRSPGTNEIIAISRGNPDLKPAKSVNFDVSAEYYPEAGSAISLAGFYKHIDNFIFTNGGVYNAPTQNGSVEITQPQNGDSAKLYGMEFGLIKSLRDLAPPFDGFGIEGNVTVQNSSAETGIPYRAGQPIRLIDAPNLLYNMAVTYQKYGFEAKVSYSYRGKYIESLRSNAVDKWVQHNRSVDLHTRYNITEQIAVDFDVANLLNDWRYYSTKGDNPSYVKDYMEPGRNYILRASMMF